MNSINFFLSEPEEKKICINRIEFRDARKYLQPLWNHPLVVLPQETVTFATKLIGK